MYSSINHVVVNNSLPSSPGRLLIYHSRVIHLLVLPPLHLVEWGEASLVRLGPLWWHWPIGYVSSFSLENCWCHGPHLSVVFQRLVRLGSFPACWRQANVTPIPKDPPSSSVANYRPISITSVLSKVFERLVLICLGWFMECSGVLPTTQFSYRKGLGTCDALCACPIHCRVH